MLSRGFLDSRPVDATTHPSDSLEVKLLKDEVNSLRAQVKEARIKIKVLEKTCQQRSKGSSAEDGAGLLKKLKKIERMVLNSSVTCSDSVAEALDNVEI